jgi:arsenate reductase
MKAKRRVVFLCTGNACRSPMAEGFLRVLAPDRYESLSAGSHAAGFVHPLSVVAMREVGIDISRHRSRGIREFLPPLGVPPHVIVSLCDYARAHSPAFPEDVLWLHWPVFDPILALGSAEERLAVFRSTRDDIRRRIEEALATGALDGPAN